MQERRSGGLGRGLLALCATTSLFALCCGFDAPTAAAGGAPGSSSNTTPSGGSIVSTGGTSAGGSGSQATAGSITGGSGSVAGGSGGNASSGAPGGGATMTGGASGSGGAAAQGSFKNYEYTGTWPTQPIAIPTKAGQLKYTKITINERFLAESCSIADYNNDGLPDVSAGRRWYEQKAGAAPTFVEHIFRGGHDDLPRAGVGYSGNAANAGIDEINTGVSDDWSDFPYDMDGDSFADIINIANADVLEKYNPTPTPAPQPHASAFWYKNPGATAATAMWTGHLIHGDVRLEQHGLVDVDGDGKPEIYGACKGCTPAETKGYYYGNWADPTKGWNYRAVTAHYNFPFGGTGWLHGEGFGDINKDGISDLLERGGAWINATAMTPNLTVCAGATPGCGQVKQNFYDGDQGENRGPSHMYAADVDVDGDNDIVAADWAHGDGLAWYEQTTPLVFVRHQFMGGPSDMAKYGVYFSEPHAVQVMDMDGDGRPDIVTGKMRFAHPLSYGDPDAMGAPVLYVFKNVGMPDKNGNPVTFQPILVDNLVGVGRQLAVGHINTDGIPDICISSKLGLFVFLGQ